MSEEKISEAEAMRDVFRQAAFVAEVNELSLRRRLMPHLDAEIERLKARNSALEAELKKVREGADETEG